MVYVSTTAYNAEKTLRRCMDSVLGQTYHDFVYYVCDNGSTDCTGQIIREYAERDPRVRPFSNRKNNVWDPECLEYTEFRCQLKDEDRICILDADDEYLPAFLEEMLAFLNLYRLDVAVCGSAFLRASDGRLIQNRALPQERLLLDPLDFAELFPVYHQFMRTMWGKLYTGKAARHMFTIQTMPDAFKNLTYGGDTLSVFSILRHVQRVGIAPHVLHRYYVSNKSGSYHWNPKRISSDQILYNDAIDFLTAFGPVSARNRNFLQAVYSNAVSDTTGVIQNAALSPADKLREYHTIASHPITLATYRECTDESAERSRTNLLVRALEAGAALGKQDESDLRTAMQLLLPRCGRAVSAANAGLFLEDRQLLQMLLRDDADAVLNILLERLRSNQGIKKYALPETVQALAADDPLLCRINDAVFLRKYGELYEKVWKGERLDALDGMAGLLMDGKVSGGRETFLELFISLAAMENQIPAFIIGKMQLADLYFRQNRREECRSIILDLTEMGVENDELSSLRQELEAQ